MITYTKRVGGVHYTIKIATLPGGEREKISVYKNHYSGEPWYSEICYASEMQEKMMQLAKRFAEETYTQTDFIESLGFKLEK